MDQLRAELLEAGTSFRDLRRELGWTQQALAGRSQVSRDTIHRFEKGGSIEVRSMAALLKAMGHRLTFAPVRQLRAADMRRKFAHLHEDPE